MLLMLFNVWIKIIHAVHKRNTLLRVRIVGAAALVLQPEALVVLSVEQLTGSGMSVEGRPGQCSHKPLPGEPQCV